MGPNANLSLAVSGYYGGNSCNSSYTDMTDAIAAYVPVKKSISVPHNTSQHYFDAVEKAASEAQVNILVLGTDLNWAREGHDAESIRVPETQLQLVTTVSKAAKGPVIVVMMTATPLDISAILANDKVGAILHVGMPSVQTLGIGDVIFGKVSPAGRAVQTIYPSSYQDMVSIFDFNMRPGPSRFPRPDCQAPAASCPRGNSVPF